MPISAEEVVDLLDRLEAAGVEASVAGGWAVDALLGRVTREHGDLDLAVDASEIDHAIEALDTGDSASRSMNARPGSPWVTAADRSTCTRSVGNPMERVASRRGLAASSSIRLDPHGRSVVSAAGTSVV
ncbi:MAG TPA: hypothetical protein VHK05_08995 [Candidatus Limnocylindrales bacterium]|nr:hypothetical protein [Candidatus Limnocylindrales bacterium]